MKAIVMNRTGEPDMLEFVERSETAPASGQVLVQVTAAGVNFMDIGVRKGMAWREISDPKVLGVEGAGRVLAVGDGEEHFRPGQRVAWVYAPGSYAERITLSADALVPLPNGSMIVRPLP
nr:alcohol dehydrogenase catalytic domain-containing protein [Mesorhizobium sp.]